MNIEEFPVCDRSDCFGCEEGHCIVLINNNFGERNCPFFKTNEQVEKELAYCAERMAIDKKGF